MQSFIQGLPKAELHVHIEGTLEPETSFALANENGIELPYETPEAIRAAYDFHDLPSFLEIYYRGMDVLRKEADFYRLTREYLEKAAAQNVRYAEIFFDPQAHTTRGVPFGVVFEGIHAALVDGRRELGVHGELIMCFLRDMSAESAAATLAEAAPYYDRILGVGLDSDEKDNPPLKFREVFAAARDAGLKLTMHCDVNQEDALEHIRDCVHTIGVDRIDHGVNSLEDAALCREIADLGLGLTVCPISNRFVVQNLTGDEIRAMLGHGMKATINSDDPAYFGGYIAENLEALVDDAGFTTDEIVTLTRNAFEVSFASDDEKAGYLAELKAFTTQAA